MRFINSPKVSILLPVWNGEKYISDAIDSILNQTFSDFELVIVNDGSSDNTEKIILSYSDKRIKLFKRENNKGIVDALNYGINFCTSPLIARQDADDVSELNRLEIQVKFMDSNPLVSMCGTGMYVIDDNGIPVGMINDRPRSYEEIKQLLKKMCVFVHGSVMYRKDVVLKIGGYNCDIAFRHAEDYELWVRMAKNNIIVNLPGLPLYRHRIHKERVSTVYSEEQYIASIKIMKMAQEIL